MSSPRRERAAHAAPGEKVWVLVNHIKPGKLDAHLRWIYDILMPAVERVAPDIYRTVRFLEPHEEDEQPEDGTYRTVWIMDPLVEGADYNYDTLLTKAYGPDQANEYMKLIDEWESGGQTAYVLKQSAW